ncbi:MAG: 2-amino-4-hydroxy-6-hydroxymethyldihydropteridine diphosphokinase [Wenzhouxiangella sp.]|jgi:2-amino-4-hydroxy-6-hydroxymethyldihydropteridine diphosphokinase|nr:2-amino-4-hydroxy-6-hydroxymethyldihydropteridine diphosphokinase [Wenzhouxiangella sp.]
MNPVWVGLGSNIGSSRQALKRALASLDALSDTRLVEVSPCYRTPPWGVTEQPDFLNAVAKLSTRLEPIELLQALKAIERELDRSEDGPRWGPREIDLDILIYADRIVNLPELVVPHPYLAQRAFVLVPLNDIAPDLDVPGQGRVEDLLASLDAKDRDAAHPAEPIPRSAVESSGALHRTS